MRALFLFFAGFFVMGRGFAQQERLPKTTLLDWTGDLSTRMHETAHRDVERLIAESVGQRAKLWHRDFSSAAAYEKSVGPNREHLRKTLGLVDARRSPQLERITEDRELLVGETPQYRVYAVRWAVQEGVDGEGLLLEPTRAPIGRVVALPDADQLPEQVCGLAQGIPEGSQFARRLAEGGFQVLVPVLLDRSDRFSGHPEFWMTNQPHREWIHRQAYMMGRHVIGCELQKVFAALDWFETQGKEPMGVVGYGEGGLLAFYASALDARIKASVVSGYFNDRQTTWEEPLYRNVFGLLKEFGDAEIATLIAPRMLIVEQSAFPKLPEIIPGAGGRKNCAAPGKLETPASAVVKTEFDRIGQLLPEGFQERALFEAGAGFMGEQTLRRFAKALGNVGAGKEGSPPKERRVHFDPIARQERQVRQLEEWVQSLVRESARVRNELFLWPLVPELKNEPWSMKRSHPTFPSSRFVEAARPYRQQFSREILGEIDKPLPPPNPRSRKIYEEEKWTGYEVVLETGPYEGFVWGILCVPKGISPDEKRPVVVCQHGRNGIPKEAVEGDTEYYHNFAARLAEQGFVTFAPHNLYRKEALYRMLSRKANTVGASMFTLIIRNHQQLLNWLGTLSFVDEKRIGFYGLSYGGESAMRIPAILEGYALSICSGDFNDWTRKVASTHDRYSFMFTDEWEMPYFNMGSTFSYAELSYLIFPRPFMVERGHHDGVAPDEWVAGEYAKTRRFYAQFDLADRTEIEFFNGGHTIYGHETFEFLRRHLGWGR